MCTNLTQLQAAPVDGISPQSSSMIQTGGNIQAGAALLGGLGDLAAGVMRARALRLDAQMASEAGQARARRIRTLGDRETSQARADATGAGVSVRSGSVLEAERQITRNVEQDAGVAILNGQTRANAYRTSAGYAEAAGVSGLADGSVMAASKWVRSRRAAQPQVGYQADTIYTPDNLA